jgi:hypothetical protein
MWLVAHVNHYAVKSIPSSAQVTRAAMMSPDITTEILLLHSAVNNAVHISSNIPSLLIVHAVVSASSHPVPRRSRVCCSYPHLSLYAGRFQWQGDQQMTWQQRDGANQGQARSEEGVNDPRSDLPAADTPMIPANDPQNVLNKQLPRVLGDVRHVGNNLPGPASSPRAPHKESLPLSSPGPAARQQQSYRRSANAAAGPAHCANSSPTPALQTWARHSERGKI